MGALTIATDKHEWEIYVDAEEVRWLRRALRDFALGKHDGKNEKLNLLHARFSAIAADLLAEQDG